MTMVLSGDGTITGLVPGGIPDATITYADIQSVAAGKVLGRNTSGAGVVQELPIAIDASGNMVIAGGIASTGNIEAIVPTRQGVFLGADGGATNNRGVDICVGSTGLAWLDFTTVGSDFKGRVIYDAANNNMDFFTNGTYRARLDSSGGLLFNSGYGSVATAYGCRAWANFNGVTTAVRGSGGVSSITQQSGISWDVAFASAMPDTNYSVCGSASDDGVNVQSFGESGSNNANRTTGKVRILLLAGLTRTSISLAVFR